MWAISPDSITRAIAYAMKQFTEIDVNEMGKARRTGVLNRFEQREPSRFKRCGSHGLIRDQI